ncbi:M18 family aminopeptidase [Marinimicrobium sp. ARAG 43.8]|uniref:M18 family aminopeptidase n=1 Tax=Marinimicrobium sp. ARAG 43.8 TaxID=3418719 RepID=UPI003CF3402F
MTDPSSSAPVFNGPVFNEGLLNFLRESPTPYHAVAKMVEALTLAGFQPLREGDSWRLEPGGKYWVTRNDSSIIAFVYGSESPVEQGIRMVGAHTDSPCLKVKPQPELSRQGYSQLGVEVYGGALLAPWFDRDLSLAGRVSYRDQEGRVRSTLVDFKAPIAIIPSLAIHLDREANRQRSINAQKELPPLLLVDTPEADQPAFRERLKTQILSEHDGLAVDEVLDFEIALYDTQSPAMVGLSQDFIASARLDNLLSCYVGLQSLLQADGRHSALLVCNDHEEVGSASACGAKGPMLQQFLERLLPETETRLRALDASLMISADNAHGVHPNFADRHDEQHGPRLNRGPVIKVNANQRYATTSESSAVFRDLAARAGVSVQTFVSRSDMECGSTIGPITSAEVGVKTLDVGVPTFAMHSIRELAGRDDALALHHILNEFYRYPYPPGRS